MVTQPDPVSPPAIDPSRPIFVDIAQWLQPGLRTTAQLSGKGPSRQGCGNDSSFWVVAGSGRTDKAGVWNLDIGGALCAELVDHGRPRSRESLVATSNELTRPIFLAASSTVAPLKIEVRSWELSGKPAPDVDFSWHWIVTLDDVIS